MTTAAKLNFYRRRAGLPLIRFDLTQLQDEDIQDLRDAYAKIYEISDIASGDQNGFFALARGHGYDQNLCHTNGEVFLTWHRSYVYEFEKTLASALRRVRNDDELDLTLPFWNWTEMRSDTHAPNGIPKVLNEPTYENANGETVPNPLFSAKSLYRIESLGLTGDQQFTTRSVRRLANSIPTFRNDIQRLNDNPNFLAFQNDFNGSPHGSIHVVVGDRDPNSPLPSRGGDMGRVVSAAYDPIFWLHHCMCDKVFSDWRALKPNSDIPQRVLDAVVYAGRIGRDLIDNERSLRYIYSENSVQAAVGALGTLDTAPTMALSAGASNVVEVPLGLVDAGFVRAELEFHRLRPPTDSYEIRAYVDNPNVDAETGYDDDSFAGRLTLFGHGQCFGAPGHCNPDYAVRDAYDQRGKHPLRYNHTQYRMDITRGLRRHIGRKKTMDDVKVYLLTVDDAGEACAPTEVRYEQCTLRTFAKA